MKIRIKVYFDFRDWWIGYYRGATHHYVCPLPTLVIRWSRKRAAKLAAPVRYLEAGRTLEADSGAYVPVQYGTLPPYVIGVQEARRYIEQNYGRGSGWDKFIGPADNHWWEG